MNKLVAGQFKLRAETRVETGDLFPHFPLLANDVDRQPRDTPNLPPRRVNNRFHSPPPVKASPSTTWRRLGAWYLLGCCVKPPRSFKRWHPTSVHPLKSWRAMAQLFPQTLWPLCEVDKLSRKYANQTEHRSQTLILITLVARLKTPLSFD